MRIGEALVKGSVLFSVFMTAISAVHVVSLRPESGALDPGMKALIANVELNSIFTLLVALTLGGIWYTLEDIREALKTLKKRGESE